MILNVTGLTKHYGDHVAVDEVSFAIEEGGSLALVGQSGSGKTTCARIIAGLESATAGSVEICGASVIASRRHADRLRRAAQVQMVFQDPYSSLDPRQTVSATITEVLREHRHPDPPARVAELLEQVGLDERLGASRPRALSGGQRQRVAIARALAAAPKLLILDESVAALDVSVQAQVLNLLADLRAQTGAAYLFVSHDLGVVRQITDDCVVLNEGRIVESGATADVLDNPQHPYTKRLLDAVPKPGWHPTRTIARTADRSGAL
jgi:ABC-type glutathione transport system ATPase component